MSAYASIQARHRPGVMLLICYAPHLFIWSAIALDWIIKPRSVWWALAVLAIGIALAVGRNWYLRRIPGVQPLRPVSTFGTIAAAIGVAGIAFYMVIVIATLR